MSAPKAKNEKQNGKKTDDSLQNVSGVSNSNNQKKFSNDRIHKASKINTQKKSDEKQIHLTIFSDKIFKKDLEGYMKTFIKADSTSQYKCICNICKDESIFAQYVKTHITLDKHRENTEKVQGKRGLDRLDKLLYYFGEDNGRTKAPKKSKEEREDDEIKKYLEFIAFAVSERLSFMQISKIGLFLKEMLSRKDGIGLNFFKYQNFSRGLISNLSSECFGPHIKSQIEKELKAAKFSISIDSSTVAGENICAIKARYLQKLYNEDTKDEETTIKSRVLGIKKLGENSTAHTFLDIVREKAFFNDNEIIQKNIIGITTDRAATLMGSEGGLISLLRTTLGRKIFHLPDPCHSLSLVVKHSLEMLPDDIRNFISDLHNYFISPQRKERLKRVQKENGAPILMPLMYVKTRWLSLGNSLSRLMEIWSSILIYMNTYSGDKGVRCSHTINDELNIDTEITQVNYKTLANLLCMDSFYSKISFLSIIMEKINSYNESLQKQNLDVSQLRTQIYDCFLSILELIIIPNKLDLKLPLQYFSINWMSSDIHATYYMNTSDLIKKLLKDFPIKLAKIRFLTELQQHNFCDIFKIFISKLLDLMTNYLPFEDPILDTLNFVHTIDDFAELDAKASEFNNHFKIVEESQIETLKKEILKLSSSKKQKYTKDAKNILQVWDRIESDSIEGFHFKLLPLLANAAQSLPTTSAGVEQTFSGVKLIKTLIRNRLSCEKIESILLMMEEYTKKKRIQIDDNLISLYKNYKKGHNEKNKKKKRRASDVDFMQQIKDDENEEQKNDKTLTEVDRINSQDIEDEGPNNEDSDGEFIIWDENEDEIKMVPEDQKTKNK